MKDSNLRPWDYEPGGLRRRLSRRVSRRRPEPARLQGFGPVSKAVIRRWADRGFKSLPSVEPPVFARLLRVGLDRSVGFPGTARSSMLTRCNRRVRAAYTPSSEERLGRLAAQRPSIGAGVEGGRRSRHESCGCDTVFSQALRPPAPISLLLRARKRELPAPGRSSALHGADKTPLPWRALNGKSR